MLPHTPRNTTLELTPLCPMATPLVAATRVITTPKVQREGAEATTIATTTLALITTIVTGMDGFAATLSNRLFS